MSIRQIFAQRFSLLRTKHELSYSDMARLLGLKNKVVVHHWEKSQKGFPNEEVLVLISNFFGVSIDWLLGRSEEMYTESTLYFLEPKMFPLTVTVCDTTVELPIEIPEDYKDYELRKQTYSLETRANIIFMLYVLSYEWERYVGDRIHEFADKDVSAIKIQAYKLFYTFMINQSNKVKGYLKELDRILNKE